MSKKDTANTKSNASHNYLNTQKSNAHTKVNGNLVQLWFGSAVANIPAMSVLQQLSHKFSHIVKLTSTQLIRPKLLTAAVSNALHVKGVPTLILSLSMVAGMNVAQAAEPVAGVTGAVLWLDASDPYGTGAIPATGQTLDTWYDKSDADTDATKRVTGAKYQPNVVNGKAVMRFTRANQTTGSSYWVNGLDIRASNLPKTTIFTVYQTNSIPSPYHALWGADNGNWDRMFLPYHDLIPFVGNDGIDDGFVGLGPTDLAANIADAGETGIVRLLTTVYNGSVTGGANNGSVNGSEVYFDGQLVTSFTDSTHPTNAQTKLSIGEVGTDRGYLDGDIAEMIIYNRKLSNCEIEKVNRYLGDKYGKAFGATPGGVLCAQLWLKADAGVTGGAAVTAWNDQSGNNKDFSVDGAGNEPTLTANGMNFNPVLTYETGDGMSRLDSPDTYIGNATIPNNPANSTGEITMIAVAKQVNAGTLINQYDGNDNFVLHMGKSNFTAVGGAIRTSNIVNTTIVNNTQTITTLAIADGTNNADVYTNSGNKSSGTTVARVVEGASQEMVIGGIGGGNNSFVGDYAEAIIYNSKISDAERLKIESYLAVKYGITLDQATATDYIASDGTTKIWDATIAGAYDETIFGIARDDASSLDQQISKSVNAEGIITLSTDTNFTGANGTHTSLADGQSLMISNDGANRSLTVGNSWNKTGAPNNYGKTKRNWKVKSTGGVGAVNIQIDVNDADYDLHNFGGDLYLLKHATDLTLATPIKMTETATGSGLWTLSGVTFADGDLVSFADKNDAPTAVGTIANQTNIVSDTGISLDVSGNFNDIDLIGPINYFGEMYYQVPNLPTGLNLNTGTGVITGSIHSTVSPQVYNLVVTAQDRLGSGLSVTQNFTWTILPQPTVTIEDVTKLENGGAMTFTATLDNAASGAFTVDVNTADGTATTADSDYTALTSHTLNFAGTAGETQTFTVMPTGDNKVETDETFTISMNNSSDASVIITDTASGTINNDDAVPVLTAFTGSVLEDSATSTTVGNLTVDAGSSAITAIALSGTGSDNFEVDNTGKITVKAGASLDFETTTSYSLMAVATNVVGSSNSVAVNITVTDANDAPVATLANNANVNIAENSTATIVNVGATDPDGDALTYSIASIFEGGYFSISSTGDISFIAGADFENTVATPYRLIWKAEDPSGLKIERFLEVTVTDENETPAVVGSIANQSSVTGTAITDLDISGNFTDPDATPPNNTLRYTATGLPSGLSLDDTTGIISGTPDTAEAANVVVTAKDQTGTGLSVSQTAFTWTVTAANTAPVISDQTFSIAENSANSTSVGTVSATDDTAVTNYAITAGNGTGGGAFSINATTGEITVADATQLDFEGGTTSYPLTVEVSDAGPLAASATVTVTVTDVNDIAPVIISNATPTVAESISEIYGIRDVISTDADTVNGTSTYQITDDPSGLFEISAAGKVTLKPGSTLDYETATSHDIKVTVNDGVNTSAEQTITITVTDVAETSTITIAGLNDSSVAENAAYTGATPTIAGAIGAVTYTLEGADATLFSVDALGVISMTAQDFEAAADAGTDNVYDVILRVTDTNTNTATQAVAVTVTDVAETSTITIAGLSDGSVAENAAYTGATPTISGAIGAVTYALEGADAALFTVDALGVISMVAQDFEAAADADTDNVYDVILRVTDTNTNTATQAVAVTVIDVDDTAPADPTINEPTGNPVTGTGEPGATVTATTPSGSSCTTTVQADGTYSCTLSPDPVDGEEVTVIVTDPSGNPSIPVTTTGGIDTTPPADPTVNEPMGNPITGTGEPGGTVTATTPSGSACTTTVQADGTYSCTLSPDPVDGEEVTVIVTDPSGNPSTPVTTTGGIDTTAPVDPTVNEPMGNPVTGTGEPGSTITATTPSGSTCTTTVQSDGSYSCELSPAPQNGEQVTITSVDPSGNPSTPVTTTGSGLDTIAPNDPTISEPVGNPVKGTAEPGSTVTATTPSGSSCTATVQTDGTYSCQLSPTPTDGEIVTVIVTDPSGNSSAPVDSTVGISVTDTDGDGIVDVYDDDDDNDGVLDTVDAFPLDPNESVDTDGDGKGNNADKDDDGDGYSDQIEIAEGTNSLDSNSKPLDADKDGNPDSTDDDDDNDGVKDVNDAFPKDPNETVDTDGDGTGNNADKDDDGDGYSDQTEITEGTDPLDATDKPLDADGDGNPDSTDDDDDNDGVKDVDDAFPVDPNEDTDTDGDGTGNNADTDDDGDGYSDQTEIAEGTNPLSAFDKPVDADSDGTPDSTDLDDDNDGVPDVTDAFPLDPNESVDTDSDGIGNNADKDDDGDGYSDQTEIAEGTDPLSAFDKPLDADKDGIPDSEDEDDDNDGIPDIKDAFPLDPTESVDTDSDGIGNNADKDDDGDGYSDETEITEGTDPLSPFDKPLDADKDGIPDSEDTDDDGDGVPDVKDAFPLDRTESVDTDSDGIGNNADTDDDGDGYNDEVEKSEGTDPLSPFDKPLDGDKDGEPDTTDDDDDNDGVPDVKDAFPKDASESVDTDSDGIGNNIDLDDDGDGFSDVLELEIGSDPLDKLSTPQTIYGGRPDSSEADISTGLKGGSTGGGMLGLLGLITLLRRKYFKK